MKAVIQEDKTGCGLASAAVIAGVSYREMKQKAALLGITPEKKVLWTDIGPIKQLLGDYGVRINALPEDFVGWGPLPDVALLAIKWRIKRNGPAWHWVVFCRDSAGECVLDSKKSLKTHRRTDLGRIKPRWFLRVQR